MRKKSGIKVIFGILITAMLLSLCSLTAFAKKTETWYTSKSGKTYYYDEDGSKLKDGKYKIGKHYYYFDEKGVQRTGWQKIGKYYYYFRIADGTKGYMKTSQKVNGITLRKSGKAKMTSYAKKKLPVLYKANVKVREITKVSDSKYQKLRKCYAYLISQKWLKISDLGKFKNQKNWDLYYARRIFVQNKRTADCYTLGVVFAYMANACGYKNVLAISSGAHGWCRIGNYYSDPDWYFCNGGHWVFHVKVGTRASWTQNYDLYEKYKITI